MLPIAATHSIEIGCQWQDFYNLFAVWTHSDKNPTKIKWMSWKIKQLCTFLHHPPKSNNAQMCCKPHCLLHWHRVSHEQSHTCEIQKVIYDIIFLKTGSDWIIYWLGKCSFFLAFVKYINCSAQTQERLHSEIWIRR